LVTSFPPLVSLPKVGQKTPFNNKLRDGVVFMVVRVALYVRVSTKGQELDSQYNDLLVFARRHWPGCTVLFYKDVVSGKEKSRPGLDGLFCDARNYRFDVVLFWALDRLSRAGTLHTLQMLQELNNLGIGWKSLQEQYLDSTGGFKDAIIGILSTLAKLERERMSERTRAGLREARRRGKVLGRPKGSKDRKKRSKLGYLMRYK